MKKLKKLYLIIFLLFLLTNGFVLAYDCDTTHPNLTDITVEIFNLYSANNKILQSEKYWIKDGSRKEDSGIRSINHFYDPIYNRTWKLGGIESLFPEVTSKIWVNDQSRQALYDPVFFSSLAFKTSSYVESKANQTYNRAIYEYIKGNKQGAFLALGHVLHLLQDLTSPPHTRANVHIKPQESSYENRSAVLQVSVYKNLFNDYKKNYFVKRNTLDDYFEAVSMYTNNNFYSDETIWSKEYSFPEVFIKDTVSIDKNSDHFYYLLGWDEEIKNTYKLARKSGNSWNYSSIFYTLDDPLVFNDYWSRLSKKAVLEGAGLIDLFFRDAEEKKKDPNFLAMMEERHGVVFFEKMIGDAKILFNYLFGLNKPMEDIIINSNNNLTTTTKLSSTHRPDQQTTTTKPKITPTTTKQITTTTTTTIIKKKDSEVLISKCDFASWSNPSIFNNKVIFNEIAWMGNLNSYTKEWMEIKNISDEKIDISKWEIINTNKSIKIVIPENTVLNPKELYLFERTDDDTILHVRADIIYVGAIRNSDEELRLLDDNCAMVDVVKANPNWPAGDNSQKRTMERKDDLSWYTSSANCINGICGTPKSENSFFVMDFNFSNLNQTSATTTKPTTTTTTTLKIITDKKLILFSEVQISGQNAYDEFIELYNPNDEDINLTNWSIKYKTQNINNLVSGSYLENKIIPSKGYFLIVSKQQDKYKGLIPPDTTFNSDSSSYSLVDNQVLILYDNYGREIDRVGWGSGRIINSDCEDTCLYNIASGQSFERKSNENSTAETMTTGIDRLAGNQYDTNNNLNDFVIRQVSDPQNSLSDKEPRDLPVEENDDEENDDEENDDEENDDEENDDYFFDPSINIKDVRFYYEGPEKNKAFIEFYVDKYPFWNKDNESLIDNGWRAMVFYLNSDINKNEKLSKNKLLNENNLRFGWQIEDPRADVLLIDYNVCGDKLLSSYEIDMDTGLVLPYYDDELSFACDGFNETLSNVPNGLPYDYNKGLYFKIEVKGVLDQEGIKNYNIENIFSENDFVSIGFYAGEVAEDNQYLDNANLIYEIPEQYFFDPEGNYKPLMPKNFIGEYDYQNYRYVLYWDEQENEENINYIWYFGNKNDPSKLGFSGTKKEKIDAGKWMAYINVEDAPYWGKIYFGLYAESKNYKVRSEMAGLVELQAEESPNRIDWYLKNVFWGFEEVDGVYRMVLNFDNERLGKHIPLKDWSHYFHTLIPLWDFRSGTEIEFRYKTPNVANPDSLLNHGGFSDIIMNYKNNARIVIDNPGNKKYLIKHLRHPLLNNKNPTTNDQGITLDQMTAFVKSDQNPDGVINNLSDLFLVIAYGMRYEPAPGYWWYDGDFKSYTYETDPIGSQVKYYLQVPDVQIEVEPELNQETEVEIVEEEVNNENDEENGDEDNGNQGNEENDEENNIEEIPNPQ